MKCVNRVWFGSGLGAFLMLTSVTAHAAVAIVRGEVIPLKKTLPDVRHLWVTPEDFTRINGFELKPQGACYLDTCIPIRQSADSNLFVKRDGQSWFNVTAFADKVQQAYVVDHESGTWSFGMVPRARKAFLNSAIAPDFALKDRNGDVVKLSDFRGKKVLIITWASW